MTTTGTVLVACIRNLVRLVLTLFGYGPFLLGRCLYYISKQITDCQVARVPYELIQWIALYKLPLHFMLLALHLLERQGRLARC